MPPPDIIVRLTRVLGDKAAVTDAIRYLESVYPDAWVLVPPARMRLKRAQALLLLLARCHEKAACRRKLFPSNV